MLTLFVFLYLVILIHECSHALAVVLFKQQVKKIQLGMLTVFEFDWKYGVKEPFPITLGLLPFIGFCSFDPKKLTSKQKIVVALAGPLGNIITGVIGMVIYCACFKHTGVMAGLNDSLTAVVAPFVSLANYIVHAGYVYAPMPREATSSESIMPLLQFSAISLSIAGFNLFPLFPLDGGHVLVNSYEAVTKKDFPKRLKNVMLIVALLVLLVFPLVRAVIQLFR